MICDLSLLLSALGCHIVTLVKEFSCPTSNPWNIQQLVPMPIGTVSPYPSLLLTVIGDVIVTLSWCHKICHNITIMSMWHKILQKYLIHTRNLAYHFSWNSQNNRKIFSFIYSQIIISVFSEHFSHTKQIIPYANIWISFTQFA